MNHDQNGLLNLVSTPQTFIYIASSLEDLGGYQSPQGEDSVELLADTGSKAFAIQRTFQRKLSPEEKRTVLIDLESTILSHHIPGYQRNETALVVSPGIDIPNYFKNKYQEVLQEELLSY